MTRHEPHLFEHRHVQDIFVTELYELEYLGSGNFRCIFVSKDGEIDGCEVFSVEAKIVASADSIKRGIFTAAKRIGLTLVVEFGDMVRRVVH